ncbi:Transporter [Fusobacterium nucleatum subsp. nucleatum ATCC 25586]|uniref:Transporter n=1 Tax=Fusobacterium nucleatum subsp. nucleatum (strain ATCC 25586 / DSM 15643 / BCRC 10681 / CIP 101130 / JCM 8532 / KCTC 2640 / LMG 13131 / VPI 4355) TaxID=190304 RepID=Q8RH95_FUSNN|nr:Transporter [Fusobacterium nucleatum subsp. nucleatum ATCC 25586]
MSILGSINSGLTNDNTILNIKAILDGVISIVLTSIYGVGVIFSAVSELFIKEYSIFLQAKLKII